LEYYDAGQSDVARFLTLGEPTPISEQRDSRFDLGKALRHMALELNGEARKQALVRAGNAFQAVVDSGTPTAETFHHLGAVQHSLGKVAEAIASYSQGLMLSADHVPLRNLRGWAYAGRGREDSGQYDLARADFSEAIRLEPENPDSHAGLGYVMAQAETADDAHREALAATLSGSDNYVILHNVACIYGRLSESVRDHKIEHENLALAALKRAVAIARQVGAESAEDEYIRQEKEAFPDSLRARPEFQRLLMGQASNDQ
jgi:Flp pilus assembly protein TadD